MAGPLASAKARARTVAVRRAQQLRKQFEHAQMRRQIAAGVTIGPHWTITGTCPSFGSEPGMVRIGEHVRFSGSVHFVTHDGGTKVLRHKFRTEHLNRYGPIEVGDNCFFGMGAIVMPDVRIGSNCVIGAGSVVTADVPDDTVVAGVPARVVTDLDTYFARCQAETLLERGATIEQLTEAAWARFHAARQTPP